MGALALWLLLQAALALGLLLQAALGIGSSSKKRWVRSVALGKAVAYLAIAGYVVKGIAVVIVGILFIIAAVTVDPHDATGLDGALKALALPHGVLLLGVIAVGLMAYGVYGFIRARLARL
ncbi:DUF1206 domain-containing protein [Arthrobacter dokdonensis]|uniref:DUF1206 domain-containing protein n=1 Tax=Arthrobacter dokdonellae TaxID=2211210 RepID=UPI001D131882|nr:DUF1206 domain-containing protein [Arthrobacter dokdonellae]